MIPDYKGIYFSDDLNYCHYKDLIERFPNTAITEGTNLFNIVIMEIYVYL